MNRVASCELQSPWDCRWTRLAPGVVRNTTRRERQDIIWICVRDGGRRYVSDQECETCEHWQLNGTD